MDFSSLGSFGLVISLAAILGIIASIFKQPAILGYIIAGICVSPLTLINSGDIHAFELFGKIGITLLLFTLGLELNFKEIQSLGKVALYTGIGQIIFTSLIGFILAYALGFDVIPSIYIAIALTFSSTVVVVKLFSEKNQLDTLHGKISVGFLLVQDFVAIMILIAVSSTKSIGLIDTSSVLTKLSGTIFTGLISILVVFLISKYIVNPVLNKIKKDKEVLFISILAWAFLLASFFESKYVGLTPEVGGLLAGIFLANRFEQLQIRSWTIPLREFFLAVFFILIGININLDAVSGLIVPTLIFSLFVIIGNPLIVMIIMGLMGYRKKTFFPASLAVAQISEFSIIMINFAHSDLKIIDTGVLTMMTIIGGITMTVSSLMIYYSDKLFVFFEKYLSIFEINKLDIDQDFKAHPENNNIDIIMFGCHRMGFSLLKQLKNYKSRILVIDFDPETISHLRNLGYNVLYADMGDDKMYKHFNLENAKIVISTVPSASDNISLLKHISLFREKPLTIMVASNGKDSKDLYEDGADFVIYPHLLGGDIVRNIIKKGVVSKNVIMKRKMHYERLDDLV